MRRILIVDDEYMFRDVLRLYLEPEGYEVECEPDGVEACHRLKEKIFDIILIDYKMPRMDGQELLCRIERLPESIRPIPFLISGEINEELLLKLKEGFGLRGNGFHYLKKPLDQSSFLLAIKSAFIGKRFHHATS